MKCSRPPAVSVVASTFLVRGVIPSWGKWVVVISDRSVSVTAVGAYVLWGIGGTFVVVGYFAGLWFSAVGLWLSGIGGVLNIRRLLCLHASRGREVFEMGRDFERGQGSVRPLR